MLKYLLKLILVLVLSSPLYILLRRPWRRDMKREIPLMIFLLFNAALLLFALDGEYRAPAEMLNSAVDRLTSGERVNLVPFRTIIGFFTGDNMDRFLVNIVGNVVMFIPWGFGLVLLWKQTRKPLRIAGLCLALPLFIELWQMFISRSVDVDDLILNFAGGMTGALLWYALTWRKRRNQTEE